MMEADWNKLIERYLQNELSEEGKEAFEFELITNPELKMEYDLHLMIMGSAIRSAERAEIVGIGKKFHFRKKLTNAAIVVGIVVLATVAYLVVNNKKIAEVKPDLAERKIDSKTIEPEVADTNATPIVTVFNPLFAMRLKATPFNDNSPIAVIDDLNKPVITTTEENVKTKEDKKQEETKAKYWVTTLRPSELKVNSSTKEDQPFYLSGNYTWSGDFMVMDTQEGLYLFDTSANHLFVFKSAYRDKTKRKGYTETVLFGVKYHRRQADIYQNRKIYKDKDSWYAY